MPCDCLDPADFVCTGNGAALLPNTTLTWFLTTDGLFGTPPTEPEVPNGNLNQLFWKLLQNDCSLANFIQTSFTRTFGNSATVAPAVNTIPAPLAGAPSTPANGQQHTVFYNNFEVLYRYSASAVAWVEVNRAAKVVQVVRTYEKTVTVFLNANDTEAVFALPETTDGGEDFYFTISDLSLLYVNILNGVTPVIGTLNGLYISNYTVRVKFTETIPANSLYQLKAIFRRTVVS